MVHGIYINNRFYWSADFQQNQRNFTVQCENYKIRIVFDHNDQPHVQAGSGFKARIFPANVREILPWAFKLGHAFPLELEWGVQ